MNEWRTARPPPPDAAGLLARIELFDGDAAAALRDAAEWLSVPAGVRLFSQGDAPDATYSIISGRVRFFSDRGDGPVMVAEAGPGVSFGEAALLISGGRSHTAVVVRDAVLVRLRSEDFLTLVATSAEVGQRVARMMAARIDMRYDPSRRVDDERIAMVPLGIEPAEVAALARELAAAMGTTMRQEADGMAGSPGLAVIGATGAGASARDLMRQADRVVLVGDGARRPPASRLPGDLWAGLDPLAAPPVELVLLHDPGAQPATTRHWFDQLVVGRHHHLRRRSASDVARLGRHLAGRSVALVLGGGGARGMAHIGVMRALAELAIPVDVVGGSSIGAIVGGQVAMGVGWEEMRERSRRTWASRRLRFDVSVPTVSVSTGRLARRFLDDIFGERSIEDLWLEFFCTSTNLTRFRLDVHRRGPVAQWVRASASAPGLWPPTVGADGELHIDGGQLNNVPTDVMRAHHAGPIIAVDVCAIQRTMSVPAGAQPSIGVRHLLRRRASVGFPSLVDTISRCALLGSLQHQATAAEHADVYLTPDLGSIGFSAFAKMDEAIDIGYAAALDALRGGPLAAVRGRVTG